MELLKILLQILPLRATHVPVTLLLLEQISTRPFGSDPAPLPPAPAARPSSLCLQHLHRAPISGPLHFCDCRLNILFSDLSDPPLPLLNKTKQNSPPRAPPSYGCGVGALLRVRLLQGVRPVWMCLRLSFPDAAGGPELAPRGLFRRHRGCVWRSVSVAMRTALGAPAGRASPFAARASASLLSPRLHPALGAGPTRRPSLGPLLPREALPLPSM